jgi:hypothetical protein
MGAISRLEQAASLDGLVAFGQRVARLIPPGKFRDALHGTWLGRPLRPVLGLGQPTGQATLIAAWYVGLTAVTLAFAYRDRGIRRDTGILIIAAYVVFTGCVLITAHGTSWSAAAITSGATAVAFGIWLVSARRSGSMDSGPGLGSVPAPGRRYVDQVRISTADLPVNGRSPASRHSPVPGRSRSRPERKAALVPGWPVRKLFVLGLELSVGVAVVDALTGNRVVLIGLLIAGPCCVLLTGRWVPAGLTGLWVIGLALVLGIPDGIWGTSTHLVFLAAVAAVALASTLAAAIIQIRTPPARPQ